MTTEEKQLLLKDLSARLPYGVICHGVTKDTDEDGNYIDEEVTNTLCELHSYKACYGLVGLMNECDIESIKPYLRPMYSMTEEEKKEFQACHCVYGWHPDFQPTMCNLANECNMFDWLIAHHFDFRGLISKGLALEAPEDMYKKIC